MMLGIIVFLLFILYRVVMPARWEFSIEAETETVEIELPPRSETRWQVDGAIVCSRRALGLPDEFRLAAAASPCGSRAWRAYASDAPEQIVRLDGAQTVSIQVEPEGGVVMSLRADGDASLGRYSVVGVVDDVDLGTAVNLIWPEVPPQSITLPFSGAMTVGRAVGWSATRMLKGGSAVVYTADESADKRTRVDEADFMLGDQVRLDRPGTGQTWPKGFVRADPGQDLMQVVAFGRAASLKIERFGESGYDFRPGPLRKVAADPTIAFWGSILAAYMTLVLSLQPFVGTEAGDDGGPATDLLKRFNRWLRSKPRK